ncbi:hypothetical protein [Nostoc sp.]
MLDHDFLAMALTCQLAVWDIADLGVGVARTSTSSVTIVDIAP